MTSSGAKGATSDPQLLTIAHPRRLSALRGNENEPARVFVATGRHRPSIPARRRFVAWDSSWRDYRYGTGCKTGPGPPVGGYPGVAVSVFARKPQLPSTTASAERGR